MLKRKRPEARPPPSYASASRYPPSQPQPEKAIERFEASHADVMRAIKKARVFDQQRLVKKIQEEKEPEKVKGKRKGKPRRKPLATGANVDGETAGPVLNTELIARLERELAVIKTLDMEITARVHLAHAMSRVKGLVDAPGPLPAHLQIAEVLATRSKAARTEDTHNVTSSLYNKPFVRDAVAKAVKEMCQLIGVSDKKEPLKKKDKKKEKEDKLKEKKKAAAGKDEDQSGSDVDMGANGINYNEEDDDEIERELAKFDAMLGGDDKDDGSDDEAEASDDEDKDDDAEIAKLRAKYKRALAKGLIADDARDDYSGEEDGEDDFEGFSGGEDDEDDSDDDSEDDEEEEEEDEEEYSSESEVEKRPRKRAAAAAVSAPGASNFLPSLMGGFMADAGDNSDGYGSDEAQRDERAAAKMLGVVRKNRRGQRARQAIWEKKYKADAKHVIQEKLNPKPVAEKWDAKRGAVDANDAPRWLRRKLAVGGKPGYAGKSGGGGPAPAPAAPKKNENANKQVTGTLHPSWEAARKAKEAAQTAEFKGTKIVFD
ncbi:cellular morphogenesis protein [Ophiostoma piceae UAMH 11346]|uniref:Cellular morphogenesis protein n=1 Tax=Ophiostoma piceae (strain UAMH 11346) TaxID=1262450 RepID=S3C387_OPHP1|nr:cellular morphogenesis protein [Ophiostoma piceae UAMH 11346]